MHDRNSDFVNSSLYTSSFIVNAILHFVDMRMSRKKSSDYMDKKQEGYSDSLSKNSVHASSMSTFRKMSFGSRVLANSLVFEAKKSILYIF